VWGGGGGRRRRPAWMGLFGWWRSMEESSSKSRSARSCEVGAWAAWSWVFTRGLLRVEACGGQGSRSRSSRVSRRAKASSWPRRATITGVLGCPETARTQPAPLSCTVIIRGPYSTDIAPDWVSSCDASPRRRSAETSAHRAVSFESATGLVRGVMTPCCVLPLRSHSVSTNLGISCAGVGSRGVVMRYGPQWFC
jgi:hypothetical protein